MIKNDAIELKKYNAELLKDFIRSDEFINLENRPISYHRALSHINNPRLNKNDFILYVLYKEEQVIAYRTVMADCCINTEGDKIRFGWLSGVWVHPAHRRKGLGTSLLKEVFTDWNGMLMYTNYAPAAGKLFNKTNEFKLYNTNKGIRIYLRLDFKNLLGHRNYIFKKLRFFLGCIDWFLNLFNDLKINLLKILFYKESLQPADKKDLEYILDIITGKNKNTFSNRSKAEFFWIFNYPWILKKEIVEQDGSKYFFSSVSEDYQFKMFRLDKTNIANHGYFMISLKSGHIQIPYLLTDNYKKVAQMVINFALHNKANMISVYDQNLSLQLKRLFWVRLFKKRMVRNYYASKTLFKNLPDPNQIFMPDGEGDVVFV